MRNGNEIVIYWNSKLFPTNRMFYNRIDIISIDLSNFDTSSVKNMDCMFYGCSSLISLNLSNFDSSLMSLDLIIFKNFFKIYQIKE